jgi:uncharacterized integral membrane protein
MQLQLIVAIIIAIVAVVFALQNAVPIAVGFLAWRFQSSLALVLLVTLALGILMSLLVSMPSMIRTRKIISNQKKKIQKLEIDLQKEVGSKIEEEIKDEEPELPLE